MGSALLGSALLGSALLGSLILTHLACNVEHAAGYYDALRQATRSPDI